MAKPSYPGLVQVPPSDRSILKRRLAKGALLIISVIGGLSSLNIWLPSSDRIRDCQPGADAGSASPDCTQTAQTVAAAPSSQTEVIVSRRTPSDAPKRVIPAQSRAAVPMSAVPSPKRLVEQSPAQQKADQATPTTTPPPAGAGSNSSSPLVATAQEDVSKGTLINPPPVTSHAPAQANPDVVLAEQGDAFAQYRLGRFYAQQSGSQSPESVSWYMKASDGLRRLASTGDGKAMYVLGVMYAFGRGVVQNREEARSWLAQALAHQVPAAGPVLTSLDKYRSADPGPPMTVQGKRPQT